MHMSALLCLCMFSLLLWQLPLPCVGLCCAAPHMAALGTHACSEAPFAVENELKLVETKLSTKLRKIFDAPAQATQRQITSQGITPQRNIHATSQHMARFLRRPKCFDGIPKT